MKRKCKRIFAWSLVRQGNSAEPAMPIDELFARDQACRAVDLELWEWATEPMITKARLKKVAIRHGLLSDADTDFDVDELRVQVREAIRRRLAGRFRCSPDASLVQVGRKLERMLGLEPHSNNWGELRLGLLEHRSVQFAERLGLPGEKTLWAILKDDRIEWKWRAIKAEIRRRAIERH